nr:TolC family outer membrane protein [Tropicibacter sp. Alg240-R139]
MARRLAKVAVLSAGVVLAGMLPKQGQADNLADALIGAYNTSGLLEQNRALLRAADEDVAIAVSALRPIIDFSVRVQRALVNNETSSLVTQTRTSTFFSGLEFTQLLYDGGASILAKQAAQETVLATRQTLLEVEQSILLRAVAAYMDVLLQEENVVLRQNNVRVLGEELRASQDRFEVGEVTRTDVALSESRVAGARANLADARGALTTAKAEYVNAVGRDPGRTAGQPRLPKHPASINDAVAIAVRNHPSILSVQHQVKAANLTVDRQRAALGPNASIRADVGITNTFGNSNYNNTASAGLVFRQPIYAGGRLAANVRRAMATRDSVKATLLNTQKDVIQAVNQAYVRFDTAGANLRATNERVRAAQVAFDGIREEATLGARTTLDVLTSEQELLDAQTSQIQARAERSLAAYQLLSAQGLLTAERLGLAVQIYDPTLYYNLVKGAPAKVSKRSKDLDRVLEALGKN